RKYFINREDVALTITQKYDLPVGKVLADEQQKLLFLPAILQQRVKGQGAALRSVSDAIFRARAGIQDPHRPLASFLFVGPTGVGKTEVALTIAELLFDEIEKSHPEVINILLQILDNGFLTLANGREVNFRNTIIVLTTNLGSE